jgi:putative acyl-CoA dehydrogenase
MTSVLADLAAESEAATTLAMRLASAADQAARGDAEQAALLRIALPAAKFWVCKRAPMVAAEALECLGGNGYVEESDLPRLYREAPLNSVWEGSGNITALDVLRALTRSPAAGQALLAEAELAAGADPRLDAAIAALRGAVAGAAGAAGAGDGSGNGRGPAAEYQARRLAGLIAVVLQAGLLARHAPAGVADVFCASRLGPQAGGTGLAGPALPFGTLPDGLDLAPVLDRCRPQPAASPAG